MAGCSYQGENKKSFYEKQVEEEIKTHSEQITKIGYVENYEVNELYNIADVMVIPSIVGDAGPLNLLEAMAAGSRIVASYIGGIPEYSNGYQKILYATYDENFKDNLMQKMKESTLLCDDNGTFENVFLYDRKFYYGELNRAIMKWGEDNEQ